jgi:hypothetical protein
VHIGNQRPGAELNAGDGAQSCAVCHRLMPGKQVTRRFIPYRWEATAQHGSPYPIRHIPERRARTCRLLIGTSTPYPNESTDLDFRGACDVSQ